jgi:hypothetical protein
MPVGARDEHVSRAVVRPGRRQHLDTACDAQPKVTEIVFQRIAREPAPLRPPCITDRLAQVLCDHLGDLVLEALAGAIGERQIIRIRADA